MIEATSQHPVDAEHRTPITIRIFHFPTDFNTVIDLWANAGPGIHLRR